MSDKLDFSLPPEKGKGAGVRVLMILLLLVVTALGAANLYVTLSPQKAGASRNAEGLSVEQVKALAAKLDQRNLHQQAAKVWQDYLAAAELTDVERANVLFQVGVALEKAGCYDEAIEQFYRSEMTAQVDELSTPINRHVKECFEQLGQFAALRYELMDRTSLDASDAAGAKVVAEIGPEKITEADLGAQIERSIENQLVSMAAFLPADQLNEQKKRLLEQYRDPKPKQEFLQNWLAQEILYRQALDEGLGEKPQIKHVLDDLTRGLLSQQLMNEKLAARIHITETDVRTYYNANKDEYIEPARAKIAHIRVAEEAQAAELLERLANGEDFGKLAQAFSLDEGTKESGGVIETEVTKGAPVPGIGDADEISAAIFAAPSPKVLGQAFETDEGWEIIRVEDLQPERPLGFDEVRQQVTQELMQQKRQEVQGDYLKEMMDKHGVIVHTSVFAPSPANAPESATP